MPDKQEAIRKPPTARLANSSTSSLNPPPQMALSGGMRSRALAKVSTFAHTTSGYVAPKLNSAADSIRQYKTSGSSSSSGSGWRDEPGVLTTPKKVQKAKQLKLEGDLAGSLLGAGLPSPSIEGGKSSRWAGLGSYFSGSHSGSTSSVSGSSSSGTLPIPEGEQETIVMFPGWASLQPAQDSSMEPALTLDILVHGYAYRSRPLSHASRSQRIFYSLAKSFASLPKIPAHLANNLGLEAPSLASQSVDSLSSDLKETALQEGNVFEKLLEVGGREDAPQRQELVEAIVEPGSPTTTEPEEMSIDERLRSPTHSRQPTLESSLLRNQPIPERSSTAPSSSSSSASPISTTADLSESPDDAKILPTPARLARRPHVRIDLPTRRAGGSISASIRSPSLPPTPGAVSPPQQSPSTRSGGYFSSSHSRKSTASSSAASSRVSSRASSRANSPTRPRAHTSHPDEWPLPFAYTENDLPRLHANLSTRILPFFGAKLPTRKVRLSIYPALGEGRLWDGALATKVISTVAPGAGFRTSVQVTGKELKKFLESTAGAQGLEGMKVRVTAELLEAEDAIEGHFGGTELLRATAQDQVELPVAIEGSGGSGGGVRVVSDVDDTIKWTEVLKGTKTIFRNVFVRELHEIRVPGMASWYKKMSTAGAHFHYVSNSPWELWPLVRDFLDATGFPKGSCTLKEYGGAGSAIAKLWEEPGQRKRANVEVLLKEFPHSQFILIGDSGEQDMQLYVSLAAQYPQNVLGIFIRDCTTPFRPRPPPSASGNASPTNTPRTPSFPPPEVEWNHSSSANDLAGLVLEEQDRYRSMSSDIPDLPGQFDGARISGAHNQPRRARRWPPTSTDSSEPPALPPRPTLPDRSKSSQTVTLDESISSTPSSPRSEPDDPPVFLSDLDADPLSPNNPIRSSTIGPSPEAKLTPEEALIEAFYAKVANCERALPKGIPLRLFRHGGECAQEALEMIKNASKRRQQA